MDLEVIARLPSGAQAFLDAPARVVRGLDLEFEPTRGAADGLVRIKINPHGRFPLRDLEFAAGLKAPCRLLVAIPEEHRDYSFDVIVRQTFEKTEVGRVTWRLSPSGHHAREAKRNRELAAVVA